MSKEPESGKDLILKMIAANIATIGFIALTGWFAYLDNGYWGWPFVAALLTGRTLRTGSDQWEEEKEKAKLKAESIKKYGYNIYQN